MRDAGILKEVGIDGLIELPHSPEQSATIVDAFAAERARFPVVARESASKYVSGQAAQHELIEKAMQHGLSACRKSLLRRSQSWASSIGPTVGPVRK